MMTKTEEHDYMLNAIVEECEKAASFIEGQTSNSLRAWAARIDDLANNGIKSTHSMPAAMLRDAAEWARSLKTIEETK